MEDTKQDGGAGLSGSGVERQVRRRPPGWGDAPCPQCGLRCGGWISHLRGEVARLRSELDGAAKNNHNQRSELARLNAEHAALRSELEKIRQHNVGAKRPA